MAYDLQEQEQLDTMKAWWARFGNVVTWVITAVLLAYAAWGGWNYYLRSQAAQAGQLYESLQKAVTLKDAAMVQRAATDMQQKFPRTAYAEMSGLVAAKTAFEANDLTAAKTQLQWVAKHGADEQYKAIAKVRLAGVLLDEKSYDAALKELDGNFPEAFEGIVLDRKGDLLVAKSNIPEAKAAYQKALEKMDSKNPGRQLIQLKLDALPGDAVIVKKAG
jgi:predicted negative regulator of RcsB-dependent stress response